jgi:hypothetical protein
VRNQFFTQAKDSVIVIVIYLAFHKINTNIETIKRGGKKRRKEKNPCLAFVQ